MLHLKIPVGLGLILAMGAGSTVWTAKLDSKDGSKISGTARVESVPVVTPPVTPPKDSLIPPKDSVSQASTSATSSEASPEELRVTITLSNAPANASLVWNLYSGKCSDSGAGAPSSVLGTPSSYSPVKIDGQGNGTSTAMVRGAKVTGDDYYIGVLRAEPGGKLAACGNLEPAKVSTGG
jgi:hypothetical protein